jgi:hypothetical protein
MNQVHPLTPSLAITALCYVDLWSLRASDDNPNIPFVRMTPAKTQAEKEFYFEEVVNKIIQLVQSDSDFLYKSENRMNLRTVMKKIEFASLQIDPNKSRPGWREFGLLVHENLGSIHAKEDAQGPFDLRELFCKWVQSNISGMFISTNQKS